MMEKLEWYLFHFFKRTKKSSIERNQFSFSTFENLLFLFNDSKENYFLSMNFGSSQINYFDFYDERGVILYQ